MERGLLIVILLIALIAWLGHRRQAGLPLFPRRGEPLFGPSSNTMMTVEEMDRMAATLDRIEERLGVVERIIRLSDPLATLNTPDSASAVTQGEGRFGHELTPDLDRRRPIPEPAPRGASRSPSEGA